MDRSRVLALVVTIAATPGCPSGPPVEPSLPPSPLGADSPNAAQLFPPHPCIEGAPVVQNLMAWDDQNRGTIARLRGSGVVVVHYEEEDVNGVCKAKLDLLPYCVVKKEQYAFTPSPMSGHKMFRDAADLQATIPLSVIDISGQFRANRAVRADFMVAGILGVRPDSYFTSADLEGTGCGEATHVVSEIYVGGFAMAAGESRILGGSVNVFLAKTQGSVSSEYEVFVSNGDPESCNRARSEGKELPQCAAPLRLGLMPLLERRGFDPHALSGEFRYKAKTELAACWAAAEQRHARPGVVHITYEIDAQGNVTGASADKSTIRDKDLVSCTLDAFRATQFWKPPWGKSSGTIDVPFPLPAR